MRPSARRRSAVRLAAAITFPTLAIGACGDGGERAVAPPAPLSLRIDGPSEGSAHVGPDFPDLTRFKYDCTYEVRITAGDLPVPVRGATLTLQPWSGGDLPLASVHQFDSVEVAGWLGATRVPANESRPVLLSTWITIDPVVDDYGRLGAHRARWAFAYGSADDSARYTVECGPAMERLVVGVEEARTFRRLHDVAVELNGVQVTTRFGLASLPAPVVAGRYRVRLEHPRYAPVDTMLPTQPWAVPTLRLRRVAPQAEYASGGTMVDPPTGGWVSVHHPDGVAHLPATLRLTLVDARTTPARRVDVEAVGTDVDATLRRYAFPDDVNGVSRIEYAVPRTGGPDVALYCSRDLAGGGWSCADA